MKQHKVCFYVEQIHYLGHLCGLCAFEFLPALLNLFTVIPSYNVISYFSSSFPSISYIMHLQDMLEFTK
jgi:hypothetical protein